MVKNIVHTYIHRKDILKNVHFGQANIERYKKKRKSYNILNKNQMNSVEKVSRFQCQNVAKYVTEHRN